MAGKIKNENKPYNIKNYFNTTNREKSTFYKTFKTTSKFSKEKSELIKFDFKKSVFEAKNFDQYNIFLANDVQNKSTNKKLMAQTIDYNKSKNNITGGNQEKLTKDIFKITAKKLKKDKNSSISYLNAKANYTDYPNGSKFTDNPCYFTYNSQRGNIKNFTNLTRRRHYVKYCFLVYFKQPDNKPGDEVVRFNDKINLLPSDYGNKHKRGFSAFSASSL